MITILLVGMVFADCGISIYDIRELEYNRNIKELLAVLTEGLEDGESWKMEYAIHSLGNLGHARALGNYKEEVIDAITQVLQNRKSRWFVKSEAAAALGKIGSEASIQVIENELRNTTDPELVIHYLIALDYYPKEMVEPIARDIVNQYLDNLLIREMAYKIMVDP